MSLKGRILAKYEKVLIKPVPNKNIGESKCLFKTCYGDLIVNWKFLDNEKSILTKIRIHKKCCLFFLLQ